MTKGVIVSRWEMLAKNKNGEMTKSVQLAYLQEKLFLQICLKNWSSSLSK